jgi:hypothetical protein
MAYLSLLEAAKRSENKLFQGLAMSVINTDALAAAIPFRPFEGMSMVYRREGTPPSSAWVPDDGTLPQPSVGTDDLVHVPIRSLGSDIDVVSLADDLSGGADTRDQIPRKARATWDLVKAAVVNGGNTTSHTLGSSADPFAAIDAIAYGPWLDSSRFGPGEIKYTHSGTLWQFRAPGDPAFGEAVAAAADGVYVLKSFNQSKFIVVTLDVSDATANGRTSIEFASTTNEFDGLNRLVASDMVVRSSGASGDALTFDKLDELLDMVKIRDNLVFVMNGKLQRKFYGLNRALGGTDPTHVSLPGYSGPVPVYRGVPILVNDHVLSNEVKTATTLSSVYLASLNTTDGLFLGYPTRGGQAIEVQADPRSTVVMGWRIEDIGALEGSARRRTRVQWHGALGLGSSKALARASEIITA